MTSTPWIEYVAAIATSVSAVVIAWQAWLTRSAVKASKDAVTLAEATLRESQIARVEARVPSLSIRSSPWLNTDGTFWLRDTQRGPVPGEYVFVLPRDNGLSLYLPHNFTVRNDGPGAASIRLHVDHGYVRGATTNVIVAGEEQDFTVNVGMKAGEWISKIPSEKDAKGAWIYPECARITVTYDGPRDSDVTETHVIVVRGSVLAPVKDAHNTWQRIFDSDWDNLMPVEVLPAKRIYWRSRTAQEQF